MRTPDPEAGGFGLAAMRARAQALGGALTVESAPGTALAARLLPAPPAETERETEPETEPEARL